MTMMQVRMEPADAAVHIYALRHVEKTSSNAELHDHAATLAAHLEFRAVRLWGADWRKAMSTDIDGNKPAMAIETLALPE